MTSSGNCHKCNKIATNFHYITPCYAKEQNGYWHCGEHGPSSNPIKLSERFIFEQKYEKLGPNRAARRKRGMK